MGNRLCGFESRPRHKRAPVNPGLFCAWKNARGAFFRHGSMALGDCPLPRPFNDCLCGFDSEPRQRRGGERSSIAKINPAHPTQLGPAQKRAPVNPRLFCALDYHAIVHCPDLSTIACAGLVYPSTLMRYRSQTADERYKSINPLSVFAALRSVLLDRSDIRFQPRGSFPSGTAYNRITGIDIPIFAENQVYQSG